MTRHWHIGLAVLVVAASLVGGVVVVVRGQPLERPGAMPAISAPPTPGAPGPSNDATDATPGSVTPSSPTVPSTGPTAGPPADTVHVDDRYRARYRARYVGWDDLLSAGAKLPKVGRACRSAWQDATKDDALNWDKAGYLCLDRLTGNGFKPQGIGGSGATEGYLIGDRAASRRNIVVVSSYSSVQEKGLVFPNQPGQTDATRLTVIDIDRGRYRQVELVRPVIDGTFTALDSHGSGFVWVGQYMYASSRGTLWMFNADDLMEIDGRYVLPAVGRWSVTGDGGLSSIGLDRSTTPTTLTGINYNQHGIAWSQSFELDAAGRLQHGSTQAEHELNLIGRYGPGPASIRSARSSVVPGTNFQGIGTSGRYRFLNSSSLLVNGKREGDTVVVLKKNRMLARFSMPSENVESLYLDYRRGTYVTVTEHGRQFLFWLPLDHLIDRAER